MCLLNVSLKSVVFRHFFHLYNIPKKWKTAQTLELISPDTFLKETKLKYYLRFCFHDLRAGMSHRKLHFMYSGAQKSETKWNDNINPDGKL